MTTKEIMSTSTNQTGFSWRKIQSTLGEAQFAAYFFVALLAINIFLTPGRFTPAALGVTLGLAAPLLLAAAASTPCVLGGGGGIDISVGPFMGLINVLIVQFLILDNGMSSPFVVIPFIILVGILSGLLNGFLAVIVRVQPIVATLGTYLIYTGLTIYIMPSPGGSIPEWIAGFSSVTSIVLIAVVALGWWGITRLPYYEHLMATGGDARATFTSGVQISVVRILAYIITGIIAAIAGLSLTALLGSADPTVGPQYTLTAIAAIALGGVSLAGGRGGILGAMLGALDIFLIQNLLIYFNVSTFLLQVAFGLILIISVVLNSEVIKKWLANRGGTS